jgi:hypothetical protein
LSSRAGNNSPLTRSCRPAALCCHLQKVLGNCNLQPTTAQGPSRRPGQNRLPFTIDFPGFNSDGSFRFRDFPEFQSLFGNSGTGRRLE